MKIIKSTNGYEIMVDDEDYSLLSLVKWRACRPNKTTWYAYTCIANKHVAMHRILLKPSKEFLVDHKDCNGLNNQKSNLRICGKIENAQNSRIRKTNRYGFKGICLTRGRFQAVIFKNKQRMHLGTFDTPEEAALAYDRAAIEHFGEFARVNNIATVARKCNI